MGVTRSAAGCGRETASPYPSNVELTRTLRSDRLGSGRLSSARPGSARLNSAQVPSIAGVTLLEGTTAKKPSLFTTANPT